ncbi:pyridoxamine 5'-phosphate oxidase family protein [Micromonospora aurantiaca (nom. illeg.)]|uniref:pyridoxamine 5'-phosphate oxidase family protein n=1 Tax=Micromonospora aurantiaca (nom. illeg.) TaxID=47850 RepID=UPI0033F936D8
MTWWSDLVAAEPEFAARVRARFAVRKHGTMATLRRDGSPRISGTEFDFGDDGHLRLGSMAGAVKALDLRRDPRVALHSPTEDAPPDDRGLHRRTPHSVLRGRVAGRGAAADQAARPDRERRAERRGGTAGEHGKLSGRSGERSSGNELETPVTRHMAQRAVR